MTLPPLPVSFDAILIVTNMYAMWLTAPTLRPPPYTERWVRVWGQSVFFASLGMLISNAYFWIKHRGL